MLTCCLAEIHLKCTFVKQANKCLLRGLIYMWSFFWSAALDPADITFTSQKGFIYLVDAQPSTWSLAKNRYLSACGLEERSQI